MEDSSGVSLLFLQGVLQREFFNKHFVEIMVFAIKVCFFGFLASLLDWVHCALLKRKSLLGVFYVNKGIPIRIWVFWSAGAFIVGFVAAYMQIVKMNVTAVATIGFGWPFLITKILTAKDQSKDDIADDDLDKGGQNG